MSLLTPAIRTAIENAVTQFRGQPWRITQAQDLGELASHPSAILSDSDSDYAVFAKLDPSANALERLETELASLHLLTARASVATPQQIGCVEIEGVGAVLLLEAVQAIERGPQQWREIGQALARIHRIKWDRCGSEAPGYFGALYQDNRPMPDWPTFYAERRLWPRLMVAIDSGNLPTTVVRQAERLIAHLPELCGPAVTPTLLHGDAQQNNFISTAHGAVIIDPSPYFGHPEVDLAHVDYFQPVHPALFEGYRAEANIDAGFGERSELWRIYTHLAITALDASYLPRLVSAIQKYV
jgi:fructosamine-3-kinase